MLIARNLLASCIQRGRALDIIAVALLVAMQIGDVAGDQLTFGVVPGSGTDVGAPAVNSGDRSDAMRYLQSNSIPLYPSLG